MPEIERRRPGPPLPRHLRTHLSRTGEASRAAAARAAAARRAVGGGGSVAAEGRPHASSRLFVCVSGLAVKPTAASTTSGSATPSDAIQPAT